MFAFNPPVQQQIKPNAPLPNDKNTYDADTIMKQRDMQSKGQFNRSEDI